MVEQLVPQVNALAKALSTPVSEDDAKEKARRKVLERLAHTL